jgi:hypothetical protein
MKMYCGVKVSPHHPLPRHWMEVSGQIHATAAIFPDIEHIG